MNPLALHLPQRHGVARWTLSAAAIVAAHGVLIGALAHWYIRTPPEEEIIPAIMVSIVPAAPVAPVEDDRPMATEQSEHVDPTPEPPKVETKAEPPPEEIIPPTRPAEIVLPKPEPKPVERKLVERKPVEKKPVERKPVEKKPVEPQRQAQEAHERAASREALHQSSVAASNAYNSLVYGHLQRFKTYPTSARGATGHAVAHFVLSRTGNLLSASIVQSSGNPALDAAALASVRSANPFPPFPTEKTGAQDSFTAPINFN
jgi:protein TonB